MLKSLLAVVALAFGSVFASVAVASDVQYNVTPLVGYQFQTKNVENKQLDTMGSYQKNHATYGLQATAEKDGYVLGVEYLRSDSNYDSYQVGVVGTKDVGLGFYGVGGVGYSKINGLDKDQEGAYFALGGGYKHQLTNMIAVKTELRGNYLSNQNQWIPTALVGFEFNTGELAKPYSR